MGTAIYSQACFLHQAMRYWIQTTVTLSIYSNLSTNIEYPDLEERRSN